MTYQECLDSLKLQPVDILAVEGIDMNMILRGIAAWKFSEVKIEVDLKNPVTPNNIDPDQALWQKVTFSVEKWRQLLGTEPTRGLLVRLCLANLIYPDGTINEDWFHIKKIEMANLINSKNGGSKHARDSDED